MTFRRILLGIITAATLGAQSFIHMTDPQFGFFSAQSFAQETANFEFAVATANRLKPDFVVITGDLVQKAGDGSQVAEYKRVIAKLDPAIKRYVVPGNHDFTEPLTAASLAAYRETFGPDYFAFREGDIAGFALNSVLEKDEKALPEESARMEAWLRTELAKARRDGVKHLIVFQHHPFFASAADEPDGPANLPREIRLRYLGIFHVFGVEYVFVGHTHRAAEAKDGGLQQLTSGPIGRPLGSKSGMRVVKVAPEGVSQRFYDFGELP